MKVTVKQLKWIFAWAFAYLVFLPGMYIMCAASPSSGERMVVLLDASGSMRNNDASRDAVTWMKKIAALCVDKNLALSMATFQGPPDGNEKIIIYSDNERIDSEKFESMESKMNQIEYDGNKTDHLSALCKAEELMEAEREDLSDSFLVILSDGNLDYVGRPIGSQFPMTAEEMQAADEFAVRCRILAEKGCRIYLMEFGNSVGIFQNLKNVPGIVYLKNSQEKVEDLESSLVDMFSQTQYPVENIAMGYLPGQDGFNRIQFALPADYDACTVFLGKKQKRQISSTDITILSGGVSAVNFEISDGSGVTILSMRNLKENSYQINLPEDVYDFYSIHAQNFELEDSVELVLYDKENHAVPRNGDVCAVNASMLPLTLHVAGTEAGLQDYCIRYISRNSGDSRMLSMENGDIRLDDSLFPQLEGEWRFELVNDSGEREKAVLIVSFQDQETNQTHTDIVTEYCKAYTGEQESLINDAIRQRGFDADSLYIDVSPLESSSLENSNSLYAKNQNAVAVTFYQSGRFKVRLYDTQDDVLLRCIEYIVSEQSFLSLLKVHWWAGGGVAFLFLLIVVLIRRRRRYE